MGGAMAHNLITSSNNQCLTIYGMKAEGGTVSQKKATGKTDCL